MAFLTEAECRKAARDGGYGEPSMGAKQATAGYRVHGLHGMKTPGLAGSYWTKAEAMRAAQQAANEEGESITISTPGKAPWITVQPRGANDANGEEFRSVAQRVVNAENDFIEVLMNLGGISHADAVKAMGTMLRLKVAKLDPGIGRINVKNGAYLDRDVIRRAVTGDALPGGFMQAGTETCDSRGTQITYELHHPNGEVTKHKAFDPSQAMAEHTIKQHAAKMGATAKITGVQMPSGAISSHPSVTGHYQNNVGDSDRATRLHAALDCVMDRKMAADEQPPRDVKYKGREYSFTGKVGTHPRDSQYAKKGETGYEYERLDGEGNKTGERIWQYANGKIQEDAAPSGLTAEDGGLLSSLLEHATGAVKAGIGAMSPTGDEAHEHAEVTKAKAEMEAAQAAIRKALKAGTGLTAAQGWAGMAEREYRMAVAKHERKVGGDSRAGRLHRALDCMLDRKLAATDIEGYMAGGVFHPIRGGEGYKPGKVGERRRWKKKR